MLTIVAQYIVVFMRVNCNGQNADILILWISFISLLANYFYEVTTRYLVIKTNMEYVLDRDNEEGDK